MTDQFLRVGYKTDYHRLYTTSRYNNMEQINKQIQYDVIDGMQYDGNIDGFEHTTNPYSHHTSSASLSLTQFSSSLSTLPTPLSATLLEVPPVSLAEDSVLSKLEKQTMFPTKFLLVNYVDIQVYFVKYLFRLFPSYVIR